MSCGLELKSKTLMAPRAKNVAVMSFSTNHFALAEALFGFICVNRVRLDLEHCVGCSKRPPERENVLCPRREGVACYATLPLASLLEVRTLLHLMRSHCYLSNLLYCPGPATAPGTSNAAPEEDDEEEDGQPSAKLVGSKSVLGRPAQAVSEEVSHLVELLQVGGW
jgi:hypothetical protein